MIKKLTKATLVTQKGAKKYIPIEPDTNHAMAEIGDEVIVEEDFLIYFKELGIIDLNLENKLSLTDKNKGNSLTYISLDELNILIQKKISPLEKKFDDLFKKLKSEIDHSFNRFQTPTDSPEPEKKAEKPQEIIPSSS